MASAPSNMEQYRDELEASLQETQYHEGMLLILDNLERVRQIGDDSFMTGIPFWEHQADLWYRGTEETRRLLMMFDREWYNGFIDRYPQVGLHYV